MVLRIARMRGSALEQKRAAKREDKQLENGGLPVHHHLLHELRGPGVIGGWDPGGGCTLDDERHEGCREEHKKSDAKPIPANESEHSFRRTVRAGVAKRCI